MTAHRKQPYGLTVTMALGLLVCLAEGSSSHAQSWWSSVCTATMKSPLCALLSQKSEAEQSIELLQKRYLDKLDEWVKSPSLETIKTGVQENCARLIFVSATPQEAQQFAQGKERDEWDFRLDVCTKMTINRVHPQPEFENPKIVKMICTEGIQIFREMCRRSKLL